MPQVKRHTRTVWHKMPSVAPAPLHLYVIKGESGKWYTVGTEKAIDNPTTNTASKAFLISKTRSAAIQKARRLSRMFPRSTFDQVDF